MMNDVKRKAKEVTGIECYFKQQHVRVVNLSWGLPQRWFESLTKGAKPQLVPDSLKRRASIEYEILKKSLYHVIQSAPYIILVLSAGNVGIDTNKQERNSESFQMPNLLS